MDRVTYEKTFAGYRAPNEITIPKYKAIQEKIKELADLIYDTCPPSRECALALTTIQECRMWANAAIAIHSPDPVIRKG